MSYSKNSASTIRVQKHAERQHESALAADPTIFDYDASYDEIQAVKDAKIAAQKEKDKERKSKYAEDIIKSHKRREIEKQSREERQQQREREKEGDEFADKEVRPIILLYNRFFRCLSQAHTGSKWRWCRSSEKKRHTKLDSTVRTENNVMTLGFRFDLS